MSPRVSVVMPCFNARRFVARSVGSLTAQSTTDWELVAIDDGSTDGTAAALRALGDPRIRVVEQENAGVSRARNRGIELARAERIAFLDADDEWHPEFLARMSAALDSNPAAVLAYCGWQNIGPPGGRGEPFVPEEHAGDARLAWLIGGCRWPIHAALSRTVEVRRAGGFPSGQTHAEDFFLWLRVAADQPIVRVPQVLAYYHFHGATQASANLGAAAVQTWRTQIDFLAERPDLAARLGRRQRRELTHGQLLRQGLQAHWRRDFTASGTIFRQLAAAGHLPPRCWRAVAALLLPSAVRARWLR